jgi:hypothetical protein
MQIASQYAVARADERVRARPDLVERRLARFQRRFRPQVLALAARHPRLKDLALSFPALLFALAVPRAGYDRERVCARVIAGAPLRELAALTQLPTWLRRLPPEVFHGPIPLLPDGAFVSRQIVNHIPRSPEKMSEWLIAVARAKAWADDGVALWVAREWHKYAPVTRGPRRNRLRCMCVWAWYAQNVPDDPCKLEAPWHPGLSLDAVQRLTLEWRNNVRLYIALGDAPLASVWLKPGRIGCFDIVPLATYADIVDEALAMRHCVRWYGENLAQNWCRLWSIRRDGERVATFELRRVDDSPFPHIAQVKLAGDKGAPEGVWNIAQMWLQAQDATRLAVGDRHTAKPGPNTRAWRRMWRPYWLGKKAFPLWMPLTPTPDTFFDF